MRTPIYAPGMRVTTRRGSFPLDAALIGRSGLILSINGVTPVRYGVTLDGETELREFSEDELVPHGAGRSDEELGATGPTVGPSPSGGSGGQH
jgi:hypothetical protein